MAIPETGQDEPLDEKMMACRCGECESGRRRGCNSSRLRELVGVLFDEKLPGLYCRRPPKPAKTDAATVAEECLCEGCSLNIGNALFHCNRRTA
ncbi:hypothetical protein [Dehalogenimonas alkenigignens]|uniref:Uncharacterized protein n=1 Tax=Dehalogenimonas alkenigignens TaxID=1217799 RepID=A0A0W0GIK4_9CHLR|nr:hypothetical protein [Dehalogenimonas alkenigignens]KTB48397.1 hypothetical protein DEALK_12430 [Dehalogenimonas alkenigignens]PVV85145.1 hypothetical protein DD509_02340 [Dehalogenimonas alkenigignens]